MNDYRFILEKGSKKHRCPHCNKKTFVRYIDTNTSDYLPYDYGRCDRESKCSYHLNPYNNCYAKEIEQQENGLSSGASTIVKHCKPPVARIQKQKTIYFDFDTFKKTLSNYESNVFIKNLLSRVSFPFVRDEVTSVIELYRLGTISKGFRAGAITFPFIDINQQVRTIQVKQFDERNKTIDKGTDFLHSMIYKHHERKKTPPPKWLQDYNSQDKKVSCLFGEHLLAKYKNNPIALVEAPKTAIYGTLYFGFPDNFNNLIWIAVYNKSSFNFDKLKVLKGRKVLVFPDLSENGTTYKEWEQKASDIEKRLQNTRFIFSDLLEQLAPQKDRSNGNDIADYLIKHDWRIFRKKTATSDKHPQEQNQYNNGTTTGEKQAKNRRITAKEPTATDKKPIKGKLYSVKELKEIFNLSDEKINTHFEEFYHNIGWYKENKVIDHE